MFFMGTMAVALSLQAQSLLPRTQWEKAMPLAQEVTEQIKAEHPGLIREKGLTPQQADEAVAAASLFRTRKTSAKAYSGPGKNLTFWFNQPEAEKLKMTVGMYYCTGGDGEVKLLAADATENMTAYWSGAVIGDKFHCISGDIRFARYGLITARDFIYDINDNWQLAKRVNMGTTPFVYALETAVDPTFPNRVYGEFITDDLTSFDIAWVDYNARTIERIGPAQYDYVAIGMSSQRRLYGIDSQGILYEISLVDGTGKKIGETGISVMDPADNAHFMQSGDIDIVDDVFYWAAVMPDGNAALYAVDLQTAKATKVHDFPKYTLTKCFTIPDYTAENGAPAAVTNLRTVFDGTATEGTVSFTLPAVTYDGDQLVGSIGYTVFVDGIESKTGSGNAGSEQTESLTLTEGLHRIDVYARNTAGQGVKAKTNVFVGLDKPGQVTEATFQKDGLHSTITWDEATGVYEGYTGPLTYTVTRYPDGKTVANNVRATSVVDDIPESDVKMYYYGIVASNGTENGPEAFTNRLASGAAYEVPYFDDFFNLEYINDNYTIIDANKDDLTWRPVVNNSTTAIKYSYMDTQQNWTNIPSDDWLILPGIKLEGGRHYQLSFKAKTFNGNTPHQMEVKMGRGQTLEEQTIELLPMSEYKHGTMVTYQADIDPEDDGIYYIGFHVAPGKLRMSDLTIDNVAIEEKMQEKSPSAVTNLQVQGVEKGEMGAIITFKAPETNNSGEMLTSLTKIRVMRDNKTLCVFDDPAPGSELTYTDSTMQAGNPGFYYYNVVATNEVGDGPRTQASGYVGIDIPVFDFSTIRFYDRGDKLELNWGKVPEEGLHKGYVDTKEVYYDILSFNVNPANNAHTYIDVIETLKDKDQYIIDYATDEGEQKPVAYGVGAHNVAGPSNKTGGTYSLIVGQPYTLPFMQSATNQRLGSKLMWVENENARYAYEFSSDSYDKDNGSFRFAHLNTRNVYARLNTGKIKLAGAQNPTLMFAHKSEPGLSFQIIPTVARPNEHIGDTLDVINYRDIQGDAATWKVEKYSLKDYTDEDYIILKFEMKNDAAKIADIKNKDLLIDAISIIDLQAYNLSVDIDVPESVTAGKGKNVSVIVHNMGEETATDYTVKLYVNDELVVTKEINEPLQSLERKVIEVPYKPDVFTEPGRATLRAEVEYLYDLDEDDNMMEAEVNIVTPDVRQPQNLKAVNTDKGYILSWEAPSSAPEDVVESFEGDEYEDFSLGGISEEVKEGMMGDWFIANYDTDNETQNPLGVIFDNARKPTAWMVFNTKKAEGKMPLSARTGNKFAATFSGVNAQDTWLISPELSGNPQTISFYANIPEPGKNSNGIPYEEWFDVMYSTVSRDTASFISVMEETRNYLEWKEYVIKLPNGAKYFAIHNVSPSLSAFALFIDDVSFQRKAVMPISYNVYSNGQLLQNVTAPLSLTVDDKSTDYTVTAVYANGFESLPVSFKLSDLADIHSVVTTSLPVDIYTVEGVLVRSHATSVKGLRKGVYIVNNKRVVLR